MQVMKTQFSRCILITLIVSLCVAYGTPASAMATPASSRPLAAENLAAAAASPAAGHGLPALQASHPLTASGSTQIYLPLVSASPDP